MGFNALYKTFTNYPVSQEVGEAADEVFPDLWQGRVATEYRLLIVKEFLERDGVPLKRGENGAYRTKNETRFDRAVADVAKTVERDGKGTVVGCALRMYDERDGATEQFIKDLARIEEKLE